jgi:hypothetical protein
MATMMFELDALPIEKSTLVHQPSRQKTARALLGQDIERWRGCAPRMTQKLLAEKAQRLLPGTAPHAKLTAQLISELELGSQRSTRLTVRHLRAIAQVLGRAFMVDQEAIEQPIVINGDTTLEMIFRKGARPSLEDPYTD